MRTLIFFTLFLVFSFSLILETNSSNNFSEANLVVEVRDGNEEIVPGALVKIEIGVDVQDGYTGTSGKVLFNITQTGTYTICGSKNNLSDVEYLNVTSIPPATHFEYLTIVEFGEECPIGNR